MLSISSLLMPGVHFLSLAGMPLVGALRLALFFLVAVPISHFSLRTNRAVCA
jgi:hypothetical protein